MLNLLLYVFGICIMWQFVEINQTEAYFPILWILSRVFVYLKEDKLRCAFYHLFRIVTLSKAWSRTFSVWQITFSGMLLLCNPSPSKGWRILHYNTSYCFSQQQVCIFLLVKKVGWSCGLNLALPSLVPELVPAHWHHDPSNPGRHRPVEIISFYCLTLCAGKN